MATPYEKLKELKQSMEDGAAVAKTYGKTLLKGGAPVNPKDAEKVPAPVNERIDKRIEEDKVKK